MIRKFWSFAHVFPLLGNFFAASSFAQLFSIHVFVLRQANYQGVNSSDPQLYLLSSIYMLFVAWTLLQYRITMEIKQCQFQVPIQCLCLSLNVSHIDKRTVAPNMYLLDVSRWWTKVYKRYDIWKTLATQRRRSAKEVSRSPSFMGRPLKQWTLREDVKKEHYYEFYLPRERECFFLTSGLVKGTSENYSEALLDILYGGGTICLESFKRCSFQEGFLPE